VPVKFKDYYQLLGVAANASDAEIKSGYRKQARKYHPDINKEPAAEERFKDINEANEALKDAKKRAAYDQLRASGIKVGEEINESRFGGFGGGTGGGEDFSDLFENLFREQEGRGRSRTRARKGEDVRTKLAVALEMAHKGGVQRITLSGPAGQRSLEVKIPAGIQPGKVIRLANQGDAGSGPGAANGDLLLEISHLVSPQFELTGVNNTDVLFRLKLLPWAAALGTKAQVATLDGNVELGIPAGSNAGRKLRLKGRGFGPSPGDHYVQIELINPEMLDDSDRAAFAAIQKHFAGKTQLED
jgi:curved DNA-binding protein